jgi:hypothetical protein
VVYFSVVHLEDRPGWWVLQADQENLLPENCKKVAEDSSSGGHGVYGEDPQEASGLPRVPLSAKALSVAKPVCPLP